MVQIAGKKPTMHLVKTATGIAPIIGTPIASLDYDDMGPEFDVLYELAQHKGRYTGGDQALGFRYFPDRIRTSLDRLRTRCEWEASLSSVVSACIDYGVQILKNNEALENLLEVKRDIDMTDNIEAKYLHELAGWFRQFPWSYESGKRMLVQVPEFVKSEIDVFSGKIGMFSYSLAILAITVTLSTQPAVLEADRKDFTLAVERFIRQAEVRAAVGKAWLGALATFK